jgi:hypothetical protein
VGDRLSSVSSSRLPPTQADESRPLAEMRDQLFSLMSLLEREQREKNQALSRISELELQLHESHFQQTANSFQPILPSQAFGLGRLPPPSPTIIPPTPLPSSPEVNGNKMKSWGFPSRSRTPTPPKEKKRESFFGLSSVLKGPAVLEEHTGIDLPPMDALDIGTGIKSTPCPIKFNHFIRIFSGPVPRWVSGSRKTIGQHTRRSKERSTGLERGM